MATRKSKITAVPALDGIDLQEFARLRGEIQSKASAALSERVEIIRTQLREMKEIVDATGVSINISDLVSEVESSRYSLDPNTDWNSSSAYC